MDSPFLSFIERLLNSGADRPIIARIINGPLVAALVKATPNPIDDLILEVAKQLFPVKP